MSTKKINIAIVGATGYVGLDLVKFLSKHPMVNIKYLCAQKKIGKRIQLFNKKGGDRVAAPVEVWKNGLKLADGETRNENNDTNDMLALSLIYGDDYELSIISD